MLALAQELATGTVVTCPQAVRAVSSMPRPVQSHSTQVASFWLCCRFPNQITNLINGKVALTRIQAAMQAEEMTQPPLVPKPANADPSALAISVKVGTWGDL